MKVFRKVCWELVALVVLLAIVLIGVLSTFHPAPTTPNYFVHFGEVLGRANEPYGQVEFRAACDFNFAELGRWFPNNIPIDRLVYLKPGYLVKPVKDNWTADYLRTMDPKLRRLSVVSNDELAQELKAGSIYYNDTYHGWKWYGIICSNFQLMAKPTKTP